MVREGGRRKEERTVRWGKTADSVAQVMEWGGEVCVLVMAVLRGQHYL